MKETYPVYVMSMCCCDVDDRQDVHESGPGGSKSRRAPELLQLMSLTVGFSSMALLRLWL